MILQALVKEYDALAARDEKLARDGWSKADVSGALTIDASGNLVGYMPLQKEVERGKKTVEVPWKMNVPQQIKKASNIASNFLCEGISYLLGIDVRGNSERTARCFAACKDLHLKILKDVDAPAARAVCAFFENWDPQAALDHPVLQPQLDMLLKKTPNLVFRFEGHFVQDIPEIAQAWDDYRQRTKTGEQGVCLVTGRHAVIARLHPSIKGVRGAQTMGASLVSFNAPAFESYGKEHGQGLNAPVSEEAAFAYGTALNQLLADGEHRMLLGDTTVVYWAENAEPSYQDLFSMAMNADAGPDFTENDLVAAMQALAHGRPYDLSDVTLRPDTDFYILGLSPNAARLSVRFFYHNTFGAFMQNLDRHYDRLQIVRPAFDTRTYLSVGSLLFETVNKKAKEKSASPVLAGALMRAILNDTRYPAALLDGVLLRIRADHDINRVRAAIVKAVLLKQHEAGPSAPIKEVLTVQLNDQTNYQPYVLGRIFAYLEDIQTATNPNLNATVKDRYFSSASATPESVFPILWRLKENHIKVLKRDKPGLATNLEQGLGNLMGRIDQSLPKHLNLEDQGVFILGYYHQQQAFYAGKKTDKPEGEG